MADCPDCCGPKDTDATHTFCTRCERKRTSVCFHFSCPDHRCNQGMRSRADAEGHAVTRYRTIVADPPWPFQWGGGKGGRRRRETELGYSTMTVDEIAALPVADFADEGGAFLFLWATDEVYREGQAVRVARAWGFEPCGPSLIWSKPNYGMGYFPRPSHEPLLVCRRGDVKWNPVPEAVGTPSVQTWRVGRARRNGGKVHSQKPDGALDLIERVAPGPYLELFARRARFKWDYWGDQSLGTAAMTGA